MNKLERCTRPASHSPNLGPTIITDNATSNSTPVIKAKPPTIVYQNAEHDGGSFHMNSITLIGAFLLVLGLVAFVVPIPQHEDHAVKIGDTKIGIQTETREKLPPGVGIVLLAGGVLALVLGSRKT
jgi:hypothetical protein